MIQEILQRMARFFDRPFFPWKKLVIGFSLGHFALENFLLFRQYRVYSRDTVPKALEEQVDRKTFDKSQRYGRAKAQFAFISSVLNEIKGVATIHFDLFPKMWALTGALIASYFPARFSGEITHSLVFVFAWGLVDLLWSLPFSYYSTFVLEEKFGFNKTTMNTWVMDIIKGQALTIAFGVPLGAAFLKIIQITGQSFFYYIWLFMLVVQVSAITIYPILIVPLFNKLTPLEPGPLKESTEKLAAKLKFPLTELQVIDGSKRSAHSNAYFTGLPWAKKIVIYDTLLEKSSPREVEAVLAHELGHWKKGHTNRLLGITQLHLFYTFALFAAFIENKSLYQSFGFYKEQPILIGFLLFSEILSPTEAIVKLGMNSLTRSMEFEADKFALDLGYAAELGSALIKLQIQNLSSMDADWMYSTFHYSHPILTERLKAMGWTQKKADDVIDSDAYAKNADGEKPAYTADREL